MIEIEGYHLILPHGRVRKFPEAVIEVIPFDEAVVVRIATESAHRTNENVFAVDYNGQLLGQIPPPTHLCVHSPYVGIYRNSGNVDAYNWDGHDMTLHPKSGLVILETFLTGDPSLRRRPRAERHFI